VVGRTLTVERRAFSEARTIRRGVRGDDFLTQPALERADHLGAHGAPLTGGGAPVAREIGPLRGLRAPLVCVSVPASVEQNTTSVELPVRETIKKTHQLAASAAHFSASLPHASASAAKS
jgi:hypothetical protein